MCRLVRLTCVGFVLLSASAVLCQQEAPPSQTQAPQPAAAKKDWREVWRNATVAIGESVHDQFLNRDYFHVLGTGIIITTGIHTAYFVTARHMFCDPDWNYHPTQLRLRFAWQEHKSTYEYLGVPFDVRSNSGTNLWMSLDGESDVAAISFLPTDSILPPEDRLKTYDAISLEDVSTDVYEGAQVFILGYPGVVGNEKLVRAILRQGIVAWTNPNDADNHQFMVDANLYQGNSGGPVIKFPTGLKKDGTFDYFTGGRLTLLGIVSNGPMQDIKTTISNPRLGQMETHTPIVGLGGFGFIEPGSKIRKLIDTIQNGTAQVPVCDVADHPAQKQP